MTTDTPPVLRLVAGRAMAFPAETPLDEPAALTTLREVTIGAERMSAVSGMSLDQAAWLAFTSQAYGAWNFHAMTHELARIQGKLRARWRSWRWLKWWPGTRHLYARKDVIEYHMKIMRASVENAARDAMRLALQAAVELFRPMLRDAAGQLNLKIRVVREPNEKCAHLRIDGWTYRIPISVLEQAERDRQEQAARAAEPDQQH